MYDRCRRKLNCTRLLPRRHTLDLVTQSTPIVRLQFRVLDPFLAPVLVKPADMVLALLEVDEFISDALLDEHAPRVLLHDRFFVLRMAGVSAVGTTGGVGSGSSYLEDGILHLLNLAGLRSAGRSGPQFLQFALIAFDTFLELRDVISRIPVPPIKHLADTDQSVPLSLEILEGTVSPGPRFILQQALTS